MDHRLSPDDDIHPGDIVIHIIDGNRQRYFQAHLHKRASRTVHLRDGRHHRMLLYRQDRHILDILPVRIPVVIPHDGFRGLSHNFHPRHKGKYDKPHLEVHKCIRTSAARLRVRQDIHGHVRFLGHGSHPDRSDDHGGRTWQT